jgi:hypothetical protein
MSTAEIAAAVLKPSNFIVPTRLKRRPLQCIKGRTAHTLRRETAVISVLKSRTGGFTNAARCAGEAFLALFTNEVHRGCAAVAQAKHIAVFS